MVLSERTTDDDVGDEMTRAFTPNLSHPNNLLTAFEAEN